MSQWMLTRPAEQRGRVPQFLDVLRCPQTGAELLLAGDCLVSARGEHRYRLNALGVPLFAEQFLSEQAKAQQRHYDKIAAAYTANLEYPHTREYLAYLNRVTLATLASEKLGTVVELCCGRGEAPALLGGRMRRYIGIDVSENMLDAALRQHRLANALLAQGDATRIPLAAASIDTVVMLGGVHHVPDRARLFAEIARILKPDGIFLYREPVSDFIVWRALRAIIYRVSPMLNSATERPLLYRETVPLLEQAGLHSVCYRTHGMLGFCFFMNSDVLFFNRVFRFVPGIRHVTRAAARLDEMILALPAMSKAGLQVVGLARKK
jgi:ubiquinone/menaquinone biosynthesis C-methylase UbiE